MNSIEELIEEMRRQGAKNNPPEMQLGTVKSGGIIEAYGHQLSKKDYLIAADLNKKIEFTCSYDGHRTEYKDNMLNPGDTVVVYKMENVFVVLTKVVKP